MKIALINKNPIPITLNQLFFDAIPWMDKYNIPKFKIYIFSKEEQTVNQIEQYFNELIK